MPVKPMLDHEGEKLLAAAAVPKGRTSQDVVQLLENRGLVHFFGDGRASFLGVCTRHRLGWYRHQSPSLIQAWSIMTARDCHPTKRAQKARGFSNAQQPQAAQRKPRLMSL